MKSLDLWTGTCIDNTYKNFYQAIFFILLMINGSLLDLYTVETQQWIKWLF